MTLRQFLWLIGMAAGTAWGAWIFVILTLNPQEAGWLGLLLFYLTLFVACLGTFTFISTLFAAHKEKTPLVHFRRVRLTFRHACLLSLAGIASLFLSSQNVWHWWTFALLATGIAFLEGLFLLVEDSRR